MQALGILGGTFDPIHFGHLRIAQELAEGLALDEVRFIPAARPPHRAEPDGAAVHRAEMVRRAISGNPYFSIDMREFGREGPSYMIDTLASLRAELGVEVPIYLIVGADAFLSLSTWHRWQELFDMVHIAVAHRPGHVLDTSNPLMRPAMRSEWRHRYCETMPESAAGSILSCDVAALDISSSAIRKILSHGHSPRYLLPDAVLDYILEHQLYQSGNA